MFIILVICTCLYHDLHACTAPCWPSPILVKPKINLE